MKSDLTNFDFNTIYSNQKDVEKFYSSALKYAKTYKRISAYFSVGIFKHLKKGISEFIDNDGYIQLIISMDVDPDLIDVINNSYLTREEIKSMLLTKQSILNKINELIEQDDIDLFSYLIAIGKLDIKLVYKIKGIVHDKFGLISDGTHNLAYIGSNNFTENATSYNDEAFQVTIDWDSPSRREIQVIDDLNDLFDSLWNNKKSDVITLELPDPFVKKMIENIKHDKINIDKSKLKFVRLDLDNEKNFIITSNFEISDYLTYKYIGEYSSSNFLNKTEKGYILKNIERTIELYDFKCLILEIFDNIGIKCYLTKRASDFFEFNYRDYNQLMKLGKKIKSNEYLDSNEFENFKHNINLHLLRPLKDKQVQSAIHIIEMERSLNFSVPGSGKTSTVIGAFEYLSSLPTYDKRHLKKLLVIGPVNCSKSWKDEYQIVSKRASLHSPLCLINSDNITDKIDVLEHDFDSSRLIIINYELLTKIEDSLLNLIDERTMVVFDEIHRIKKIDSLKYKALKKIIDKTRYRVALTGTPLPNGYIDLYNMFSLLHDDFVLTHFNMYENELKHDDNKYRKTGLQNISLNKSLFPFYIRVSKEDLKVPLAERDHIIEIQTNNYERELYFNIKNSKFNSFESTIKMIEIGCVPFKCNQSIDYYDVKSVNFEKDLYMTSKLIKFLSVIKKNNNKCVVWCNFVDTINIVTKLLNDNGYYAKSIYGETPQDERDKTIDEFNYGQLQMIVTNPATLAESVSLHKSCHEAHYLELNYNLYQYLQSRDRIHRLGLKDTDKTNYYIYINFYDDNNKHSKDYEIYKALQKKEELMKKSIEKGNFFFDDSNRFES